MAPKQLQQLIKMAEQIALNLGAGHDDATAAHRTGVHIRHFWTPAMRRQLGTFRDGGGKVSPIVAAALAAGDDLSQ
ncbi:MAG: formate dehydrogenase subunit delta [Halioglobus sp.]|nr:formate dehydrogenase subunit delta [Halioglobus sp.]MCB1708689.1 formate dehydrogenase subunit delta [Halioglobus sp.]MCP5121965.1 formate dehydrogenase subunit delta [Pseudomonadales bacterium]MCP5192496.1 formate dehydrogenase subunit delta [Pseudomonadales bacterium]